MPEDKRFLNFPLVLLARTIENQKDGMAEVMSYAINSYAKHCEPATARHALVQLAYCMERRKDEALPKALVTMTRRADIRDVAESLPEVFIGDGEFDIDTAAEIVADVTLRPSDARELTTWYSQRAAMKYFNRIVTRWEAWRDGIQTTQDLVTWHEQKHGALVWASLPYDFFTESAEHPKELPLLRMVAAARSIIGRKPYAWATKGVMAARCIGAKSPAVADAMSASSEALGHEYQRMQSRKVFDRIMTESTCRGFFEKVGLSRRLWLSTEAQSPGDLAATVRAAVTRKHRRDKRRRDEADARRAAQ